jgi:hypothetical protein
MLQRLNGLQDARGDRVAHANEHVPTPLYQLLIFTSLVWLVPFLFLDIASLLIWFLIVGGVAFTIFFLIELINELDNPYKGMWQVSFGSFKNLAIELDDEVEN